MTVLLAMDRAPSARRYDAQGFLHLSSSNISKANVCPYMGREIPGWQELGLDGDRVYRLLRHPDEIAKAAPTFDNLPLLSQHVPVDADGIPDDLIVGSTGSQGAFDGQYLTNSLVVWKRGAIDGVESNRKRQLSSAYRYRPDMTPGNFRGMQYDGIMRDIVGNHVALVIEGRAGPDVLVGDENTMKTRTALMTSGALAGLIRPMLAADAQIDLAKPLADVTAANIGDGRAIAEAVHALAAPQLAADKALTIDDVQAVIRAVPTVPLAEDALSVATPAPVPAMDEAAVRTRIDAAVKAATDNLTAIRAAEREVHPHIGEVAAMDSAAAYYEMALDAAKIDRAGITDVNALRAMVRMLPKPGEVAQDAAFTDTASTDDLFKGAKPLIRS